MVQRDFEITLAKGMLGELSRMETLKIPGTTLPADVAEMDLPENMARRVHKLVDTSQALPRAKVGCSSNDADLGTLTPQGTFFSPLRMRNIFGYEKWKGQGIYVNSAREVIINGKKYRLVGNIGGNAFAAPCATAAGFVAHGTVAALTECAKTGYFFLPFGATRLVADNTDADIDVCADAPPTFADFDVTSDEGDDPQQ